LREELNKESEGDMEEKILEQLWAVVWEARGGVSVIQVEELIRRNRQRFFSSDEEIKKAGGYAVLGFAKTMEEALEGRRAVWRMKKEAEGRDEFVPPLSEQTGG
jgi:hypothetical protein